MFIYLKVSHNGYKEFQKKNNFNPMLQTKHREPKIDGTIEKAKKRIKPPEKS